MKILWVSHFLLYPETGFGALQRSRNLLVQLSRQGHEVWLLSLAQGHDAETLERARENLETFCEQVIFISYTKWAFRLRKLKAFADVFVHQWPYSTSLYHSEQLLKAFEDLLRAESFDVIHADTMGLIDSKLSGIPCSAVLNHHNVESQMLRRRAEKTKNLLLQKFLRFESKCLERYEKRFCGGYDGQIVVSKEDQQQLQEVCGALESMVVENPVDTSYFTPGDPKKRRRQLLFVGGMDWYPNADAVSHFCENIWPLIARELPDVEFVVVGRDRERESLQSRHAQARIRFTGFVDDVRPYYQHASVFVCPMRDGGGTKLKIVDALSSEIPIVSTSFGCLGLSVTAGEQLLIADTPIEFAESVVRLLSDQALAQRIAATGRQFVLQNYSAEVLGRKLEDAYRGINK